MALRWNLVVRRMKWILMWTKFRQIQQVDDAQQGNLRTIVLLSETGHSELILGEL